MVSDVSAKVRRLVVSASNKHVVSHHVSLARAPASSSENPWGRQWQEGVSKTQALKLLLNPGTRLMCLEETLKRRLDAMFSAVIACGLWV
jgi:hypothetical protein